MKQLKKRFYFFGVLILMVSLSGCLESSEVTFFKPGVYQGSSDPLSADVDVLVSRLQKQMDR